MVETIGRFILALLAATTGDPVHDAAGIGGSGRPECAHGAVDERGAGNTEARITAHAAPEPLYVGTRRNSEMGTRWARVLCCG